MHSRCRSSRLQSTESPLDMAPMIDVVFLLLIFFIVTAGVADAVSGFDVNRPSARQHHVPLPPPITIDVTAQGYSAFGSPLTTSATDRIMATLAGRSLSPRILVRCTPESSHETLMGLLDICARHKVTNISLSSM